MRRFYVSMIVAAATLPAAGRADTISTLFNFPKQADGNSPAAPLLVLPSGALAGTTVSGGNDGCSALEAPSGCGTVFALLPGAAQGHWTETVLHVFDPRKGDGAAPAAALISDAFGNFYGTTSAGGGACKGKRGCGTVFELSPPGPGHAKWTETVLHAFAGPDGKYPQAALVRDSGGNLYGTTCQGGAENAGTVFELSPGPAGVWQEVVLASMGGVNSSPLAPLVIGAGGVLYGTASPYSGAVFAVAPGAGGQWTTRTIYTFPNDTTVNYLAGLALDEAGNLYGTTSYGGGKGDCGGSMYGCGRVFRLAPPAAQGGAWTETDWYLFTGGKDGQGPFGGALVGPGGTLTGTVIQAGLAVDTHGVYYGTTSGAGSGFPPFGTVFAAGP